MHGKTKGKLLMTMKTMILLQIPAILEDLVKNLNLKIMLTKREKPINSSRTKQLN